MLPRDFAQAVMSNAQIVPGLPTLRRLIAALTVTEDKMLMAPMDYSRHKDSKESWYSSSWFRPCHHDHTEHKDKR